MERKVPALASLGLLALLAGCGGGGGGGGGSPGTPTPTPADTTPNAFAFNAQSDATRSAMVTSNEIVISGITAATPISITGGEYSIDGGAFTSAAGTVNNNQHVRVRVSSSAQFSTPVSAVLTVGGVTATFMATTAAPDTTPDPFQFARKGDAARNAWTTSASVTISGIDAAAPVTVENGEYCVGNGSFTTAAGTISSGQTLTVRVRSGTAYSKVTRVRVTVGGVSGEFEVTSELPKYVPDRVAWDGDDTIYLQSNANRQIYRWSVAEARYLDAFSAGLGASNPVAITYSDADHRLYLGYDTGAIRYISTTAATPVETPFANTAEGVGGLVAVGKFLLAQDGSGAWSTHYVFNNAGVITDQQDWNYYSGEYAWDAVNSRVYFFRDDTSPNDLHYEVIDQNTGQISGAGETPYHGSYSILKPIRVSNDGQYVLLGSGDFYKQPDLSWAGSLGMQLTDARWFANGSLVALTTLNNQTTLRRVAANNGNTLEQLTYTGQALRVVGKDGRMAVVLVDNNDVKFQIYVPNDDGDGDGVANTQDAFPLDAAASVDTDRDGYPDAWNPGKSQADSTTGLVLDAFPNDAACYLPAHGSGGVCNFAATLPNYVPDQVVQGGDVVYLLSIANKRVYRWSISAAQYLNPYVVGLNQGFNTLAPSKIAYSADHQRLYIGYSTGAIQYISTAAASPVETPFANTAAGVGGLAAVGKYVLAQDGSGAWSTHYVFSSAGLVTDQKDWNYYSGEYAWDAVKSRVYFFRDDTSPNDLHYEVIDQATGKITGAGETPYHGDYAIVRPIRVSVDGQLVLLGSGDLYETALLKWSGSVGGQVTDARWAANGTLVTLAGTSSQTTLRRLASNSVTTLEQLTYTGQPLRVVGTDTRMAVLLISGGTVQFRIYVPSDDSDGDGVLNTVDAFPLDAAASVDSDHDGYPDAWNPGKSAADSTTGLTLDSFPNDAACWLPAHGTMGACNYGATIPNYVPDQVVQQGDIVYLLSSANKRVYRWSMSQSKYLNPYVVGFDQGYTTVAPSKMAYSPAQNRLYLGYPSGAIRYIDVNGSSTAEVAFANTAQAVGNLASVGNFLLAQDSSYYGSHYVLNASGAIVAQGSSYYSYSGEVAWDAVNSRAYYPSSSSLQYETINQTTGAITPGSGPYNYTYYYPAPLRVSPDGHYLLTGGGDIFDSTNSFAWAGSVGGSVTDARWFANNSVVVLTTSANQTTLRRRGGSNLAVLEQVTYTGQALRVVGTDALMVVLVVNNGTVQFHSYVANNDSDGDGVANTADAFPLDPAASVDTDHDGYPNAWNAGKSQADSTTGLVLDSFPNDAACWLPSHGSGGVCNYGATVPNYIPDQVVQQGNVVYLLSSANKRVYRWSMTTSQYLNPYVVGQNLGFSTLAPTTMTYSTAHARLYLGYSSGAVTSINVGQATPPEMAFATVSQGVTAMTTAGNYLFLYAGMGYLLDSTGTVTTTGGPAGSRDYGWDASTSRLYYFRDGTSPNDLEYFEVNQSTGQYGTRGETPYHGSYNIMPPIRVSASGAYVLLGSGDIYNQTGLTWAGSLGAQIADARWFANGSLVTLATNGNQTTLRRLGSSNLATLEQLNFTGQALRVLGSDTAMVVLTINNGTVQFANYVPNDDSDGDGVTNTTDAFPLDAAASVDTDHDGYPNAWNAGKTQADSTTGLTLDSFPNDAACWLPAHGSGGVCNYGATIPNYTPDQVVTQGNTVYLLSSANKRVYRWSIATGQYLNPYIVGINQGFNTIAPTRMAYSAAHQRLYLGYETGAIRYLDVTSGTPVETPFANIAMAVGGLAAAGSYLVAQDGSGAWATHYVINSSGAITDQKEWNHYSSDYAFDAGTSRLYSFTMWSPADMQYEVVDQATGKITSSGETPYHGNYSILPPIRLSPDGGLVLLGSGDLYEKTGLNWAGTLGKQIKDARWTGGVLVDVDTSDLVEIRNADSRAVLQSYQYLGQPIALVFGTTEAYLVHVAQGASTTSFVRLPFYDQDSDQIPRWWEQLYGLSDSSAGDATGDLDSDGVNNRTEYQKGSNPTLPDSDGDGLSDSAEIVTWLTNPARVDSDGDGLNDYAEVITYHSNPNVTDSDGDTFTDYIEAYFGGNATDASVLPVPMTSYSQTFEGSPNLATWTSPVQSLAPWAVDTTGSRTGVASFKAGTVGANQSSVARFRGYFRPGTFTFYAKVDGSYSEQMQVLVDGAVWNNIYGPSSGWVPVTLNLTLGVHDIEWRYTRDYSVDATDAARIDDVVFTGQ